MERDCMSEKKKKVKVEVISKDKVRTIPSIAPIFSSRDPIIMSGYVPSSGTF